MLSYAYFPGCSMSTTGTTYRLSIEYVCRRIGLELREIPDWNCCGATSAHSKGKWLGLALPARSLGLAENRLPGMDICVPCASCYSRLLTASKALRESEETRKKIAEITGMEVKGSARILTLMDVLSTPEALAACKAAIVRDLSGLRAACYYGCLTSRPREVTGAENIESPMVMDELISLTGAECVDWDFKTECCGGSHQVDAPSAARPLIERIFRNAKANGAQAIITACPLCNLNLDMREEEINRVLGTAYDIPVYQFTEILAMAMGASAKEIGIQKHFYPAFKRIDKVLRKAAAQK
jgi:heterodisulfide reductase subunit B